MLEKKKKFINPSKRFEIFKVENRFEERKLSELEILKQRKKE